MSAVFGSDFEGRTAIVTGASRGIGLAIAKQLLDRGANVIITARKAEALAAAVESLGSDRAVGMAGNAADAAHQLEVVDAAVARFGSLDFLVNNTGINPAYGPLLETDLDTARKIVEVNVFGTLSWIRQAHRAWMGEHGGAVVNIGSVAGLLPSKNISMYGASKAMLTYMTQALAVELGPGIRVNGVAPAVVKTDFAQALYSGREEDVAAPYPLKRLGVPEDIAGIVSFLLSEQAAWMTGQIIVADGGVTLVRG